MNKKVLLRECKRHTTRRVTALSPNLPIVGGGEYAIKSWQEVSQGTPCQPNGVPPIGIHPPLGLDGGTPPPVGRLGYPLLRCELTNKLKTVPSPHPSDEGGKNSSPIYLHWDRVYWSPRKWQNILNLLQGAVKADTTNPSSTVHNFMELFGKIGTGVVQ